MSDEECDDLPPISVNSSIRDSSSFSMPSAEEVASQRARAAHCERQLLRLRQEHRAAQAEVAALAHSDSSGSEGEAALSAAVGALRVRAPRRPPAAPPARLLAACAPHLPAPPSRLLRRYVRAAESAPDHALAALDDEVERALTVAAGGAPSAWEAGEAGGAALWAAAALAGGRPGTARLAHALLDDVLDAAGADAVGAALDAGVADARARLVLADALWGGGSNARAAAARLSRAREAGGGGGPAARYVALQTAARALAAGGAGAEEARRALAASLAAPRPRDACPDALKVVVAATKLRVLFDISE